MIGSLSLATDLAMGFPFEHGLHSTLLADRIATRLDLDAETRRTVFFGCLLFYAGCTTDAEIAAQKFRPGALLEHFTPVVFGSPPETARGIIRALGNPSRGTVGRLAGGVARLPGAARGHRAHITSMCEVAEMLAERLAVPSGVPPLFRDFTARWDGRGESQLAGRELPIPLRVVHVARDVAFQRELGGPDYALDVVRQRAGKAFDPDVVATVSPELLGPEPEGSVWHETLALEPAPQLVLRGPEIDHALEAVGAFADLISACFTSHSATVAALASQAATARGLPASKVANVYRAGLLHDLGRVAVATHIWIKPGPLTADEWEHVRLHAHHTERVLAPSPQLAALGAVAGAHHERLDGSGYHRGSTAQSLTAAARLVAAADAYRTAVEPRPHRAARSPADAAAHVAELAGTGLLDAGSVGAVLDVAGQALPRIPGPAGLTDRETEVVVLVAQGLATKQIAHRLGISAKTADRHIQNSYAKMGVSTRASATLFAMQHGLDAWGDLPMSPPSRRS
ncbi:MAG: HD domain-containing phosphohydrolase [Nocardioides sp.]